MPNLSDILGYVVNPNPVVFGIASDSRLVKKGFIFVALAGTRTDGVGFIGDALSRGAVAIVAEKGIPIPPVDVPVIRVDNVRRGLSLMAARFYPQQPEVMTAVTGTNGKTSTAIFVQQIWELLGHRAAALGTLGVVAEGWTPKSGLTTFDPISLHQNLSQLAAEGVEYGCMEASSHGLEQHRMDGVSLYAGAITNLTRDHLDYHKTMESYIAAKLRLFSELLPSGAGAVINMDSPFAPQALEVARERDLILWRVGRLGVEIRLVELNLRAEGYALTLEVMGRLYSIYLPLVGGFQVSNVLTALGLVLASGEVDVQSTIASLEKLQGIHGRLQKVASRRNGGQIYVDYAHTPDALDGALTALRPHCTGKLSVVFGCGGDRDKGKRELMAEIAVRLADSVIVTDDNPRGEEPELIRASLIAAAPTAMEIADRAQAIMQGVKELGRGDILVIAGKGHEQGQIVGDKILPFDDSIQAIAAVQLADKDERAHEQG